MKLVKEYVALQKEELKKEIVDNQYEIHLVIIQLNDNPASNAYIKGKIKDCSEVGIKSDLIKLPEDTSEENLLNIIKELNLNPNVNGIIVQLPLPSHINQKKVSLAIDPKKDVDGFHPLSLYQSATPKGIVKYLSDNDFEFSSKNALVIGRSEIVGRPVAKLLLAKNMNVTITHSKTTLDDLKFYVAHADLIVIAIGKEEFLDERFIYKKSAILIDVGINRDPQSGKLVGDAKKDLPVAFQTPVPGGVGLLTRLALLFNCLEAYKNEL